VLAVLVVGSHAVPVVIVTSNSTGQGCSAIDAGIWASRQAQFLSDVKECGEGCTSERHCTADCMHEEHDYTIACALCMGDMASCGEDHCFKECALEDESTGCRNCVIGHCKADFGQCSQLSAKELSKWTVGVELHNTMADIKTQMSSLTPSAEEQMKKTLAPAIKAEQSMVTQLVPPAKLVKTESPDVTQTPDLKPLEDHIAQQLKPLDPMETVKSSKHSSAPVHAPPTPAPQKKKNKPVTKMQDTAQKGSSRAVSVILIGIILTCLSGGALLVWRQFYADGSVGDYSYNKVGTEDI